MTYTDVWVLADSTMTYSVFITGGTGDFDGITGRFIDEGEVDSYEFTLTAPVGRSSSIGGVCWAPARQAPPRIAG